MWRIDPPVTSLGAILLSLALAGPVASAKGSRLEAGQKLFNQGDFEGALKQLELAVQEERESAALEKVHLLRGQCFSARQDFVRAEDAFALALESNPEASLDPARVDPTVVKVLEAVRGRLTGTLTVNATAGAVVTLDAKPIGDGLQVLQVSIGRHKLEAKWDGPASVVELVLKPKREVRVEFVQGKAPPPVIVPTEPEKPSLKAYADARGLVDLNPVIGGVPNGWFELGGGIEFKFVRAGVNLRFPNFGVTARVAAVIPIIERVQVSIEGYVPVLFRNDAVGWGVGASIGGEYLFAPVLGAFAQFGGQYLFANPNRADAGTLNVSGGVRLHLF